VNPDQRYDTLNHMQKPTNPNASWEIGLSRGVYRLHTVVGDPANFDGKFILNVEAQLAVAGVPATNTRFFENTIDVPVLDGRLTISNGPGAVNNKINFVDIERLPIIPGTAISDVIYIRLNAAGNTVQVFDNAAASGTPFFAALLSSLGTLTVNGEGGNDTIIVDMTNGNPIPSSGLIVNGQGDNDTFTVLGEAALTPNRVITFNGGAGNNLVQLQSGHGRIEANEAGGTVDTTVDFDAHLTTASLKQRALTIASDNILGGGLVTILPNGGAEGLVKLQALSIGTDAILDVSDNDLLLTYPAPGPNAALAGTIQQWIDNWYFQAEFTPKIASSQVTATGGETVIVAIDNAVTGFGDAQGSPHLGEILGDSANAANPGFNQVLLRYTYGGDFDLNGEVDALDYAIVDTNLGSTVSGGGGAGWQRGDGDFDGTVTPLDYSAIDANLGKGEGNPLGTEIQPLNGESAAQAIGSVATIGADDKFDSLFTFNARDADRSSVAKSTRAAIFAEARKEWRELAQDSEDSDLILNARERLRKLAQSRVNALADFWDGADD